MKKIKILILVTFSLLGTQKTFSQDGYEFIGEIKMFSGNFAPNGWALCNGQLLSISQNTALFSILGTTYGGNGQTTFALPDLRGRVPISSGQGLGLTNHTLGEANGIETITLSVSQLPAHSHTVNAVSANGNQNNPSGNLPAHTGATDKEYTNATGNTTIGNTGITGGGQAVNNMQPYAVVNYIICLYGIFPARN